MASGKIHNRVSAIVSVPTGILVGISNPIEGFGAFLGCLSGMLLTPDLDQEGFSAAEHWLVRKTWIFGFAWLAFWYPYSRAIPHRSPWSHWPVIGTALRLIYCIIPLAIIWFILECPVLVAPAWVWVFLHGGLEGLVVSDIGHWILDWPLRKKRKRE